MDSQLVPAAKRKSRPETKPDGEGSARGRRSRKPGEPLSVLVVDDDELSVKLVAVVLRSEGCLVETARSAEEARDLLRTLHPDVIVLDLILPLMSGVLLAEQLKSDAATKDIVLIAVTAFNGSKSERVAFQAGFSAYVKKPIDPAAFAKLVFESSEEVR